MTGTILEAVGHSRSVAAVVAVGGATTLGNVFELGR